MIFKIFKYWKDCFCYHDITKTDGFKEQEWVLCTCFKIFQKSKKTFTILYFQQLPFHFSTDFLPFLFTPTPLQIFKQLRFQTYLNPLNIFFFPIFVKIVITLPPSTSKRLGLSLTTINLN